MSKALDALRQAFNARYADPPAAEAPPGDLDALARLAARASCRAFIQAPVPSDLVQLLCAVALAAPTKSDLQQRDIIQISKPDLRHRLNTLTGGDAWVAAAPVMLVFCGNNSRQRRLHEWRGRPFANDHLDAFFNAAVDAAIALATFVTAAEAAGLGCCPLSAIRNRVADVSEILGLPDHVFPVAGLVLGWPATPGRISRRLPLAATVHRDRYKAAELREKIEAYDQERATVQPYEKQRYTEDFGASDAYTWSEDKARQYAKPERADFGAFIRRKGFRLD